MSPIPTPTPIPNYNVLIRELARVRDNALPEFWYFEDEIWSTYTLVSELITDLWAIDKLVEAIDFNQAIEIGRRFESVANRLFSLNPDIKRAFNSEDTTVSWRRSTTRNIVKAIESEARLNVSYFLPFVSTDFTEDLSPEEEDELLVLRTQIRLRAAKDDNAKNAGSSSSGQTGNNVPQPTVVSEFYRLQRLPTRQGKSKAAIHKEIAQRNAKKAKRTLTEAQLTTDAARIKKAIRDYEQKVNQQQ